MGTLLLQLTPCAVRLARRFSSVDWAVRRQAYLNRVRSACNRLRGERFGQPFPEEGKLEEIGKQRLLAFWRSAVRYILFICVTSSLYTLSTESEQLVGLWTPSAQSDEFAVLKIIDDVCFRGYFILSTMMLIQYPRLLRWRNFQAWMIVTSIHSALFVIAPLLPQDPNRFRLTTALFVALAISCWKTSFVLLINLAWAIAVAYSQGREAEVAAASSDCSHIRMQASLVETVVIFVVTMFMHFTSKHLMKQELRMNMQFEAAFEKLLRGMCDAVVYLDRDFAIKRKCPELNALLLQDSLTGGPDNFLDLLNADGKSNLHTSIRQEVAEDAGGVADPGSVAATTHVEMRNSLQVPIQVQLYCASYVDATGELCHMVGIRDSSNVEGMGMARSLVPRADAPDVPHRFSAEPEDCSTRSFLDESDGMASRWSNDAAVMPLEVPTGVANDEVSVWTDSTQSGMPMTKCTAAFYTYFGGPSLTKNTHFLAWVPRQDRASLLVGIEAYVNRVMSGSTLVPDAVDIELRPLHLPRHAIQARMVLSMESADSENLSDSGSMEFSEIKMTFSHMRLHPQSRAAGKATRQPSPPRKDFAIAL